jgi:glutamine synthetase adenylyltransferase
MFEEYWPKFDGFTKIIENCWNNNRFYKNDTQIFTAMFKSLLQGLNKRSKNLSKLLVIIPIFDGIEDEIILLLLRKNPKNLSLPIKKVATSQLISPK